MLSRERRRTLLAFALLFACYQAAEGVGARLFGSFAVQSRPMHWNGGHSTWHGSVAVW
jgi:hypothetical protein